jgi:hypothetical protein
MSTQYRLVQSGKTASGGCSAGPRFVRACSATDILRLFGNRVLRIIFGLKKDEITGEWRKLHKEELHNLYSSPNTYQ